jgi:mono/diheme cytochrome c family protein
MPSFLAHPGRKKFRRTTSAFGALITAAAVMAAAAPLSPELARGRALYDTNCAGCHDRSVHQREARLATNFAELRAQVIRWNVNAGTNFRPEDIDQVTAYLNARYYDYPCPPEICGAPARAQAGDRGT